ncbi:MAG: hypothetical protein KGQ42_05275, partial [Alphaproteobacteria bacterium]|nr:hypothetical protein [Alphaproteobacteria bacterium]
RKFNWCLAPEGTPLRTHWTQMFADQEGPKPMVPVESGSVMVLRQLLLGSDFLTVLSPDQVAMELRAGLLVKISDVTDTFSRTIAVSTRIDWRPTPMQRKLFDALITTAHLSKTYSEQSNPIGGRA